MTDILILATATTLISALGVAWIRRWTLKHRILDVPNERSSHAQATPRGGGIAIVGLTLAGVLAFHLQPGSANLLPVLLYVAGGTLIAAVSWWDDLRSVPVHIRFTVHAGAALMWLAAGPLFPEILLPGAAPVAVGKAGIVLAFFWIVGLTNAYNFMDGIDGIAGVQALVAGIFWTLLGWQAGVPVFLLTGTLLACSSLGFLIHNWPPARIFMGDVGSAFLGYSFAVLPLLNPGDAYLSPRLPVLALLPVWPFVFDTAFTFCRRLLRRENVLASHRSHLYQRLVISGWSHRTVTSLYGVLAVLGAGSGLLWIRQDLPAAVLVAIPSIAGLLLGLTLTAERSARRP